jgi:hypothetical protein
VFSLLSGLVARSLVVADRDGPDTRYRLLETIREYGQDRLAEEGETVTIRSRHGEHYLALDRRLFEQVDSPNPGAARPRMMAEQDNLLAAYTDAVDTGNLDVALGLWTSHWGHPIRSILVAPYPLDAIKMPGAAEHRLYPAVLATAAMMDAARGDLQAARDRCAAATQAAERLDIRDPYLDYSVQESHASALSGSGSIDEAARAFEDAAQTARSAGLSTALAWSLATAALQYILLGDRARALPLAIEAVPLARRHGEPGLLACSLNVAGAAMLDRDPHQANALLRESAQINTFGDTGMANSTAILIAARVGEWERVIDLAGPQIHFSHWRNYPTLLGSNLAILARAVVGVDPETSARLQPAARRLMTPARQDTTQHVSQATPTSPPDTTAGPSGSGGLVPDLYRQTSVLLREALGEQRLRQLRADGDSMDVDQIVALAHDAIARAQTEKHS